MTRPLLTNFPEGADPFQEQPADHSGLDFAYGAGRVRDDNTIADVAAGTVTLTDATTNYIEVTGGGAVSANTSGFTSGRIPLYTVVTAAGAISTVTDRRTSLAIGSAGGGSTELLAKKVYDPGTDQTHTTASATFADVDATNLVLPAFTAPASGDIVVVLTAWTRTTQGGSATSLSWNLRDGSGDIAGSDVKVMQATSSSLDFLLRLSARIPLTGLTGTKSGWKWGYARTAGTGTTSVFAGPSHGPALMEVWAA